MTTQRDEWADLARQMHSARVPEVSEAAIAALAAAGERRLRSRRARLVAAVGAGALAVAALAVVLLLVVPLLLTDQRGVPAPDPLGPPPEPSPSAPASIAAPAWLPGPVTAVEPNDHLVDGIHGMTSPSGRVRCGILTDVADGDAVVAGCRTDYPVAQLACLGAVDVPLASWAPDGTFSLSCLGDGLFAAPYPELPYGHALTVGDHTVASFEQGIAMWDTRHGDGFLVNQADGVRRFEAGSTTPTPFPTPSFAPLTESCPIPASLETSDGVPSNDFAFLRHADGQYLVVDPAEFLTGDEAVEAARQAGELGEDGTVDNDYYIRNTDTTLVRVPLADGFTASLLTQGLQGRDLDAGELAGLYCGADRSWMYDDPDELPVTLTVRDGKVTIVEQAYRP